jgi:hypothetical protein
MKVGNMNTPSQEEEETYIEKPEPCYIIEGEWAEEETE